MHLLRRIAAATAIALPLFSASVAATGQSIILQSTTSTANSGLYDYLLPVFTARP